MTRTQAVTILFCDLVTSTERRARLGDDAFDEFSARFMAALDDAIARHNGRNIASAGDGLMVVFPNSVADAVACSTAMHKAMADVDPADPPRLRIGISAGEVAEDGDQYSGMPIVEAARLEASAAPGQTLANAVVRTLIGSRRAFRFRDVGELTLKGIPAPLAAVEVVDGEGPDLPPRVHSAPTGPQTPPTSRRRVWRVAVAAVLLLGVAATVTAILLPSDSEPSATAPRGITAPEGYTPTLTSVDCPSDVKSVAADATCSDLVVPQDRTKPDGKSVTLLVTSAPARKVDAKADPTIDVCGCEDLGSSLARDDAALIHVSMRGYTGSDPELTCPAMSEVQVAELASRSLDAASLARGREALAGCHTDFLADGVDPAQYNYRTAARDLLDLMYVMDIERANFVAFEDADAEVFEVLREAPAAVRSITLDNPPPPGTTVLVDPIGDLSGAFDRFVDQCDNDATCAEAYPDLRRANKATVATLDAEPVLLTIPNPEGSTFPPVDVLLDGPRAALALATALADPATYPVIPTAIDPTDASTALATVASVAVSASYPTTDAPWGAAASFICSYDLNTQDPEGQALKAQTLPEFVRAQNAQWTEWCKAWPVPDVSPALSEPIVSDVPAFVFRGDLSPHGNPDWIPALARGLSNVQTAVFPTLGSDLLVHGPACLSALRRSFLQDPTQVLDSGACEALSPPIRFVAPTS